MATRRVDPREKVPRTGFFKKRAPSFHTIGSTDSSMSSRDATTFSSELVAEEGLRHDGRGGSCCSVRYASEQANTVCTVLSRADYSQEELADTWYCKLEYQQIARACVKEVYRMDKGETLRDKKYCSRGLEHHTKRGAVIRRKHRHEAQWVVMAEQEQQRSRLYQGQEPRPETSSGGDAALAIAKNYKAVTSSSQKWAHVVGLKDRRAVNVMLEVDRLFIERRRALEAVFQANPLRFRRGARKGSLSRRQKVLHVAGRAA